MKKTLLVFFLTITLTGVFLWVYFPLYSRYRELKLHDESLSEEIARIERQIAKLAAEKELLKNDVTHLEKVIRQELGLVKPGEVVYKFVTEPQEDESESVEKRVPPLAGTELSGP